MEGLLDSQVAQWFAATAATMSAGCGLILVYRNTKNKSRTAAIEEADSLQAEVESLRAEHLKDREAIYELKLKLVGLGLDV